MLTAPNGSRLIRPIGFVALSPRTPGRPDNEFRGASRFGVLGVNRFRVVYRSECPRVRLTSGVIRTRSLNSFAEH